MGVWYMGTVYTIVVIFCKSKSILKLKFYFKKVNWKHYDILVLNKDILFYTHKINITPKINNKILTPKVQFVFKLPKLL